MNPDQLAELEEQRRFLVRSLDDLDRELGAGDIDALDARTLRDDYTHRLADVQRAIEGHRVVMATHAPPRRLGRRITGIVVVAGMALGAGLVVANAAGSRKPGDTLTGNIATRNVDGLLSHAAEAAQKGDFTTALRDYDTVLAQDPRNVEALAEQGLLLASLAGAAEAPSLLPRGEELVRQAIAIDTNAARAYFYLGLILRLRSDPKGAIAAFDDALARNPAPNLKPQIKQYREQTAAGK